MAHLLGVGIGRKRVADKRRSAELRDLLGIRLTMPVEHKLIVWTQRTLMLTNVSLHLFSQRPQRRSRKLSIRRRGASTPEPDADSVGTESDSETRAIPSSSDLKRSVGLSDIFEVNTAAGGNIVKVGTAVNGTISALTLRCASASEASRLNAELQRVLRAYTLAVEHMKRGWLVAEDRQQGEHLVLVSIKRGGERNTEEVVGRNLSLAKSPECVLDVDVGDVVFFVLGSRGGTSEVKFEARRAIAAAEARLPLVRRAEPPANLATSGRASPPMGEDISSTSANVDGTGGGGRHRASSSSVRYRASSMTYDDEPRSLCLSFDFRAVENDAWPLSVSCPSLENTDVDTASNLGMGGKSCSVSFGHVTMMAAFLVCFVVAVPPSWFCRETMLGAIVTCFACLAALLVRWVPPFLRNAAFEVSGTEMTSGNESQRHRRRLFVRVALEDPDNADVSQLVFYSNSSFLLEIALFCRLEETREAEILELARNSSSTLLLGKQTKDDDPEGDAPAEAEVGVDPDVAALGLPDSALPERWISACEGNVEDALRRWRGSLAWRAEFSVSQYVIRPQPMFYNIKANFPHAFVGLDNFGNLVTLERMGGLRSAVRAMKSDGITAQDFATHMVFLNEYFFRRLKDDCPNLKQTKIVDLDGVGLSDARKEVKSFFDRSNFELTQYPELLNKIVLVNTPAFFTLLWRVVAPMLPSKTRKKIEVVGVDPSAIEKELIGSGLINPAILPVCYGGTFEGELSEMDFEAKLRLYVDKVNDESKPTA